MAYPNNGTYPSAASATYGNVTSLIAALPARATSETIEAAHMNLVQAEIIEIENALGTSTALLANPAGGSAYADLAAKLSGIYSAGLTSTSAHSANDSGVHGVGTGQVVGTNKAQTLSNKILTSPTVNGGTVNADFLTVGGVAAVDLNRSQTLSNKTLVSPTITGTGNVTASTAHFTSLSAGSATVGGQPVLVQGALDNSTLSGMTLNSATITGGSIDVSTLRKSGVNVATLSGVESLSNKTLENPTLSGTVSGNVAFDGDVTFTNQIGVPSGFGLVPAGTIIMWYGKTAAPAGWLDCDGTSVDAGDYPELAAAFNVASGPFNLPDFTGGVGGLFPRATTVVEEVGTTSAPNVTGQVTLTGPNLPQHRHDITHDHGVAVSQDLNTVSYRTGDDVTKVAKGHQHTGHYRSDFAKGDGKWDVLRPQSTGGYAQEGNANGHPDITYGASAHTHVVNVINQSTRTSDYAGRSPETIVPVDVIPPFMRLRFLIKT